MADISIARPHRLSADNIRSLAEKLAAKLQSRHGGEYHWESEHCVCYRHGNNAEARVEFDDAELRVDIKLGRLLAMMKPLIEGEIDRYLDDYLA